MKRNNKYLCLDLNESSHNSDWYYYCNDRYENVRSHLERFSGTTFGLGVGSLSGWGLYYCTIGWVGVSGIVGGVGKSVWVLVLVLVLVLAFVLVVGETVGVAGAERE